MLINYTPHTITRYDAKGKKILETYPAAGATARVTEKVIPIDLVPGIPVVWKEYGKIEGVPAEEEGHYYIVSILVLQANKGLPTPRTDLLCPDTGPDSVVRDTEGRILGIRRFQA